ncbi:MAG: helix-turn-helix domain-containing protein [Candidatus Aminicenantes bacterium]|nr:helix-turn-helix domain-containing protein [Candidatus Aminicenantes bacterium]
MIRKSVLKETSIKIHFQLLIIIFVLLAPSLHAPAFFSEISSNYTNLALDEYITRTWTTENGLNQNTITSLVQSKSGYIWIATPTGLVRFDGVQFTLFSRAKTPALANDRITVLYEDENENLWIGTDGGGLYSLTQSQSAGYYQWKLYSTREGLSHNNIRAITSDWHGNVWVGTDYGLNRISKEGIRIWTTEDGLYDNIITSLALDIRGYLWAGTLQGGLARIQDYAVYNFGPESGLLNPSVFSLMTDPYGSIWVGTMEGLYFLGRDQQILQYIPGTSYTPITSILRDSYGDIWIGTRADGLMRRRVAILSGLSLEKRFPGQYLHCLLSDNAGNLWIGTDTDGLIELKIPVVKNITRSEGLPENTVLTLIEGRTGTLWAGTRNSGLCRIRDNRVDKIFNQASGLISDAIRCLYEDNQGVLWIGTQGGGINILESGRIEPIAAENIVKSGTINAIIQDTTGEMWIGTDSGLSVISGSSVDNMETKDIPALEGQAVKAIIQASNDVIYIATSTDLFFWQDGSLKEIEIGFDPAGPEITTLYADRSGILWIGTDGSGLRSWSDGKITAFTTKNGFIDDYIYGLTEDNQGSLWMSSNRGIMRIKRDDIFNFIQGKIDYLYPSFYDENNGMASRQGSSGGQPSLIAASSGFIYCTTTKGIAVVDPGSISEREEPAEVLMEDIRADDRSIYGSQANITLSRRPSLLELEFTAIDMSAPDKIRFEYQLRGIDSQVNRLGAGEDRTVSYINPEAGLYRFKVRAINNDGIPSGDSIIEIKIKSPFYRTTPFYIGLIVLAFLLAAAAITLHHQKKVRKLADKYKTSGIDQSRIDEIIPKLVQLMEEEKLYLDAGLTLKDLARKLRIHYNHLSRIINERFGLSYNDFINRYRIAEAQRMLGDPKNKDMNILDIIYEAGFYSKSVFNTAFKKFTGKTPSEYRRSLPE